MISRALVLVICLFAALRAGAAETQTAVFDQAVSTREWTLQEINPDLPADWTGFDFLVLEWRASSSQRFELGLKTAQGLIAKRVHPYPGVWVRASIPLRFYRQGLGNANDLAATVNQPRNLRSLTTRIITACKKSKGANISRDNLGVLNASYCDYKFGQMQKKSARNLVQHDPSFPQPTSIKVGADRHS